MPDIPAIPARPAPYTGGLDINSGEGHTIGTLVNNPQRIDARNWWRRVLAIFAPAGGRKEVHTTDYELQSGPGPLRVTRQLMQGRGNTGPHTATLPLTGSWAYIPGMDISTKNAGRAVVGMRTVDDGVSIPAVFAGNPNTGG